MSPPTEALSFDGPRLSVCLSVRLSRIPDPGREWKGLARVIRDFICSWKGQSLTGEEGTWRHSAFVFTWTSMDIVPVKHKTCAARH